MKAVVAAFNQEKALVGAFSVIVKTGCGTDGSFYSTSCNCAPAPLHSSSGGWTVNGRNCSKETQLYSGYLDIEIFLWETLTSLQPTLRTLGGSKVGGDHIQWLAGARLLRWHWQYSADRNQITLWTFPLSSEHTQALCYCHDIILWRGVLTLLIILSL